MSSKLRPCLGDAHGEYCPRGGTAYLMIYTAVRRAPGLIHGHLHDSTGSCAIGCYFKINHQTALSSDLIDEVAAVNDSVPHLCLSQRRLHVLRWLRWKLTSVGMPGFEPRKRLKRKAKAAA